MVERRETMVDRGASILVAKQIVRCGDVTVDAAILQRFRHQVRHFLLNLKTTTNNFKFVANFDEKYRADTSSMVWVERGGRSW